MRKVPPGYFEPPPKCTSCARQPATQGSMCRPCAVYQAGIDRRAESLKRNPRKVEW